MASKRTTRSSQKMGEEVPNIEIKQRRVRKTKATADAAQLDKQMSSKKRKSDKEPIKPEEDEQGTTVSMENFPELDPQVMASVTQEVLNSMAEETEDMRQEKESPKVGEKTTSSSTQMTTISSAKRGFSLAEAKIQMEQKRVVAVSQPSPSQFVVEDVDESEDEELVDYGSTGDEDSEENSEDEDREEEDDIDKKIDELSQFPMGKDKYVSIADSPGKSKAASTSQTIPTNTKPPLPSKQIGGPEQLKSKIVVPEKKLQIKTDNESLAAETRAKVGFSAKTNVEDIIRGMNTREAEAAKIAHSLLPDAIEHLSKHNIIPEHDEEALIVNYLISREDFQLEDVVALIFGYRVGKTDNAKDSERVLKRITDSLFGLEKSFKRCHEEQQKMNEEMKSNCNILQNSVSKLKIPTTPQSGVVIPVQQEKATAEKSSTMMTSLAAMKRASEAQRASKPSTHGEAEGQKNSALLGITKAETDAPPKKQKKPSQKQEELKAVMRSKDSDGAEHPDDRMKKVLDALGLGMNALDTLHKNPMIAQLAVKTVIDKHKNDIFDDFLEGKESIVAARKKFLKMSYEYVKAFVEKEAAKGKGVKIAG